MFSRGAQRAPPFLKPYFKECFMKKLIVLYGVLFVMLAGCGMQLKPTPEKVYRDEIEKFKMIKEHQALQLEIMKINAAIAQMQAPARQKVNVPELGVEGEFIPLGELPKEMQK